MYDVIIVGAGASGLFASLLLSRSGKKVLVLEQNTKAGKKLALCGGGSCNLGPVERESGALSERYSQFSVNPKTGRIRQEPVRALKTLYYAYPPGLVRDLWTSKDPVVGPFRGLGIELREENGLLFPARFDARSLADELCTRSEKAGAEFRYSSRVEKIAATGGGGFSVSLDDSAGAGPVFDSRFVILSSGGFSYPAIGGSDSGNGLLERLGISCRPGFPAMGPVRVRNYPFSESSGTVIPARVTVASRATGAELVRSKVDQLLFTHRGLSGPVILDICAAVHEIGDEGSCLSLDLLPSVDRDELLSAMQNLAKEHPLKQAVQLLSAFFPRVLSAAMLEKAGIDAESLSAEVSRAGMQKAAGLVKALPLECETPTSRHEAMSWTGGCECAEIDFASMEAKKAPGLFITGDMVAMCRPCGGYSLWFCWTSALAASIKINKY